MSQFKDSLSNQIDALKKKQRELELIAEVVESVNGITAKETIYQDVSDRVRDLFTSFANRAIQVAEKGRLAPAQAPAISEPKIPVGAKPDIEEQTAVMPPAGDIPNKIKFAMAHRHLGDARVKVGDVEGVVRGIDAPYIIVITDDNRTLQVSPEKLTIIQGRKAR